MSHVERIELIENSTKEEAEHLIYKWIKKRKTTNSELIELYALKEKK